MTPSSQGSLPQMGPETPSSQGSLWGHMHVELAVACAYVAHSKVPSAAPAYQLVYLTHLQLSFITCGPLLALLASWQMVTVQQCFKGHMCILLFSIVIQLLLDSPAGMAVLLPAEWQKGVSGLRQRR